MSLTYLDYNATTPVWPQVVDAVSSTLTHIGNPSSVHSLGAKARKLVDESREKVAAFVNCEPKQVVFTSGGTEANNLALNQSNKDKVLVSSIEHESILDACNSAEKIAVAMDGVVNLDNLESILRIRPEIELVCVMLANNETGVLQPIEKISLITKKLGIRLHTDAIQAAGKIDINWQTLGVSSMSISGHKIGGPQGVGALILEDTDTFRPLAIGGGQERKRRAGTENLPGIVGFGVAASIMASKKKLMDKVAAIRDDLESRVLSSTSNTQIYGREAARLPNTSCVSMPGVPADEQVAAMDLKGFMISAGSACSSGKVEPSHVLMAMGASKLEAADAIRVSLGWNTTVSDIKEFFAAWLELYDKNRRRASAA